MNFILFSVALLTAFPMSPVQSVQVELTQEQKQQVQEVEIAMKRMYESSVALMNVGMGLGRCSGVLLTNNKGNVSILTAKHCIGPDEELYVEDHLVTKILVGTQDDIALIYVDDPFNDKTPVKFADGDAKRKDMAIVFTYPNGQLYVQYGPIAVKTKDWQFADIKVIPGCSGGPIFNERGELIGIIWGSVENQAIFEPVSDVRKFLKVMINANY